MSVNFRNVFERLESLGRLGTDDSTDLYELHVVHIAVVNKRIDELKECHDHHPLCTVSYNSTKSLYLTSSLNNKSIKSNTDPENMRHFYE